MIKFNKRAKLNLAVLCHNTLKTMTGCSKCVRFRNDEDMLHDGTNVSDNVLDSRQFRLQVQVTFVMIIALITVDNASEFV